MKEICSKNVDIPLIHCNNIVVIHIGCPAYTGEAGIEKSGKSGHLLLFLMKSHCWGVEVSKFLLTSFMDGPDVHFLLEWTLWFHIQKPWQNFSCDVKIEESEFNMKSMNHHFSSWVPNEEEDEKWREREKRKVNMVWQSSIKIKIFPNNFPKNIILQWYN